MRVVFCIYDFVAGKLPLQPWLTIRMVAEGLAKKGHVVHVVTDIRDPAVIDGVVSYSVASLRGSNAEEMRLVLGNLRPEALVMLPTPLNITTASWLDGLGCRCIGFASYPFYSFPELWRAWRRLSWIDVAPYLRHLLIPGWYWRTALCRRLDSIIAQSLTTGGRLRKAVASRVGVEVIPPGIDVSEWPLASKTDHPEVRLLYLGAATAIRGFDLALEALTHVEDERVILTVLARGADDTYLAEVNSRIAGLGLAERVAVQGSWIERGRLIEEIQSADAVLQPFVLVPSELPVTAMEVIACGTPVIGSAIDGLPSAIGGAGVVVRQGSALSLAEVITEFARNSQMRLRWRKACLTQRGKMLAWDAVVDQWEKVLCDGS